MSVWTEDPGEPVGEVRAEPDRSRLAGPHHLERLGKPGDDGVDGKLNSLISWGPVEHGSVGETPDVADPDVVGGSRGGSPPLGRDDIQEA